MTTALPILCIPRVFANIKEERIRKIFDELLLGSIDKIDFTPADKEGKFNRVFIHFRTWAVNQNASRARARLDEGKEIKIVYDDPWFWKVSAYRKYVKQAPQPAFNNPKRPTIQFDCDEEKQQTNRDVTREFMGSYNQQQSLQNKYQPQPQSNYPKQPHHHAKVNRESYTNNTGLPVAQGLNVPAKQMSLRARSPTGPPPINIALANSVPAKMPLRARSPTGPPPINIALANSVPAKKLPLSPHSPTEPPPSNVKVPYEFPVVVAPSSAVIIKEEPQEIITNDEEEKYKNEEHSKMVKPVEFEYENVQPAPRKKKIIIIE
jgi:hypothetical protein